MIITDKNLNTINTHFNIKDYPMDKLSWWDVPFYKYKDTLLLTFPYCDTIYNLNNGKLLPYIALNTGDFSFYKKIKNGSLSLKKDRKNGFLLNQCVNSYQRYNENEKFLSLTYFNNNNNNLKICTLLFNKITGDLQILRGMINDIIPIKENPLGFDANIGSLFCIDANHFAKYTEGNILDTQKYHFTKRFIQTYKNINAEGNPIVCFMR